jgi:hypothetical protein
MQVKSWQMSPLVRVCGIKVRKISNKPAANDLDYLTVTPQLMKMKVPKLTLNPQCQLVNSGSSSIHGKAPVQYAAAIQPTKLPSYALAAS